MPKKAKSKPGAVVAGREAIMAVLPDAERAACHATLMRLLSDRATSCSLTKAQLRAAVDATDDWIDQNAAAYNTALPVAARNALTATQKLWLFLYVARRRAGEG